jgi:hypothetical protein
MLAPQQFDRIGKALRNETDEFVREPLPKRWVELILYLDEKERRRSKPERSEIPRSSSYDEGTRAARRSFTLNSSVGKGRKRPRVGRARSRPCVKPTPQKQGYGRACGATEETWGIIAAPTPKLAHG